MTLDTTPVSGNPETTIRKARQIRLAALAPAASSPQDRAVAAKAATMELKAKKELEENQRETSTQDISFQPPNIDLLV